MGVIELVEKTQMTERPQMQAGDTVKVHVKVREGDKERIQVFEGIVIGMHRGGVRAPRSRSGRSRSARASSASFRCIRRSSRRWKWCARQRFGARSSTSSAISRAKRPGCARVASRRWCASRATRPLENVLRKLGFNRVCGVDEVGRGCLAGPVVAGAVVLHPDRHIPWLSDSKTVPAAERDELFEQITSRALAWAVAEASPDRDRRDQHSPGVAAGDAARGDGARAAARSGARRRVPDPGSADGPARRRARRSAVLGDRRSVHHRQGHERSADAAAARRRIRDTGSIGTKAMRPRITWRQ